MRQPKPPEPKRPENANADDLRHYAMQRKAHSTKYVIGPFADYTDALNEFSDYEAYIHRTYGRHWEVSRPTREDFERLALQDQTWEDYCGEHLFPPKP